MNDLIIAIVFGIVAMLVLAFGIIFFIIFYQRRMLRHQEQLKQLELQKQRELLQASIQAEEEERMRIASELHDDVGVTLSSIKLFLHTAAKTADKDIINQSRELLDESIQKIRGISHKLQPSTLQHLGLQSSVEALAEVINKTGSIRMECALSAFPPLDENVALAVYRVIQELLNNIIKHSNATSIHLLSGADKNKVVLTMTHNGDGLTDEAFQEFIYKKGAIGLKNIVNRIRSIHAEIHFEKADEEQYQVNIYIPYNK
jgi:signal transduction histidine kinase